MQVDPPQRRRLLRACTEVLDPRIEEIATLLTRELGKPLGKAVGEVSLAAQ